MSGYQYSVIVLVPADLVPESIAAMAQLGYTAEPSVLLSADGEAPATHFGLHTWAQQNFRDIITGNADSGIEGSAELIAALTVSVDEDVSPREHFTSVVGDAGLVRVG